MSNKLKKHKPSIQITTHNISKNTILTNFNETRYVKNNINLQHIFDALANAPSRELSVPLESRNFISNTIIQNIIENNEWKEFDTYCAKNIGIDNFWSTLQNIFYLHYYLQSITFLQFQKALGIQQARWSVDSENTFQASLLHSLKPKAVNELYFLYYDTIEFTLFQDIDDEQKIYILNELSDALDLDYYALQTHLRDSIWYKVSGREDDLEGHNVFGTGKYYGIPASYDLSALTCTHQPTIVFGSLSARTMVDFIIDHNKRPYAGHLPESKSNLYNFDDVEAGILCNWYHELFHQKKSKGCDVFRTIRRVTRKRTLSVKGTKGALKKREKSCDPKLFENKLITRDLWKTPEVSDCLTETLSLELTDEGDIFEQYNRGGKKRRTKRRIMKTILN